MVSRFAGAAAASARAAHDYYFSDTFLYVPRQGNSVPFDGVPGKVTVEMRNVRGETRSVAVRQIRVTSGIDEIRHDAAIRIGTKLWSVEASPGRTPIGGLTVQVVRTLTTEIARPNYRD